MEGRLESTLRVDNRLNYGVAQFEEWGDFLYKEPSNGVTSGLSLAARLSDGEWDSHIHQLYIEKDVESSFTLKAGRFERADGSGYYTLDGGSLRKKAGRFSADFYGGVPRRIEDYRSVEGKSLIGLDTVFANGTEGESTLEGRLGYQRFEDENAVQRVNWGLRVSSPPMGPYSLGLSAGGSYIPDGGLNENLLVEVKGGIEGGSGVSVSYELYEPEINRLSFRDRFYSLYASGKEEVLKGRLYYTPTREIALYGEGRRIDHESGTIGYGGIAGASFKKADGGSLEGEISNLYLNGERALSLFVSSTTNLTAFTVLRLGGGWQIQQKRTTGENQGLGLEAEVKSMLKGNLFASAYAMRIWNSRMDDEYRGMVRLTYTFNQMQDSSATEVTEK